MPSCTMIIILIGLLFYFISFFFVLFCCCFVNVTALSLHPIASGMSLFVVVGIIKIRCHLNHLAEWLLSLWNGINLKRRTRLTTPIQKNIFWIKLVNEREQRIQQQRNSWHRCVRLNEFCVRNAQRPQTSETKSHRRMAIILPCSETLNHLNLFHRINKYKEKKIK